ncbi:RNA polymerase III largest subunit Rpc1 [Neocallimastix lanati (nom. inval.)]|jgi:DNA-directed RNA polymerase III subunit RPC1|uniref:DNA-directed RNA polymerase subunit n=1 Tax=Neocallimastix californiae TaxID=1754190 RepID=A0A1Y2DS41_9FUNG|nr:RNA polymerase III largest subunit Rpc1 [Neocallimastix sp. JGI-2020a]ORY61989.1 beta and beta-prime subunits of DNA dependent RNA-polymerase [Neocallimastix californiae]|eukprot:ORY61989.1 beta and beta-prime subunits of DNA dependent RNA-polymerase [Neocallimastix californiae]
MKAPVFDTTPKKLKKLEFGVLSTPELAKLSVLEVNQRDLYDTITPGRPPVKYGALDRRMGTSDKTARCETCGETLQDCVGHYGFVRLAVPVFHIGYFKQTLVVLQNICKTCGKVLLEEKERRKYLTRLNNPGLDDIKKRAILKALNTACKKVSRCPYCRSVNGVVKKVGALKIIHERYKPKKANDTENNAFRETFNNAVELDPSLKFQIGKAQEDLNPLIVYNLFCKITSEDCEILGLDPVKGRPENFLWTSIPVPPICIRPSVAQNGASNEDDITVLISDIVFINTRILHSIQSGETISKFMEHWEWLQLLCAQLVNADLPGVQSIPINMVKIKRGFCQRLKGKQGRFRGNLSGKRVDFSARTVISPDPNLQIEEVAVPELVAKVLTYPERVFEHNIEKLRKCVLNGPDKWPGAVYIRSDKKDEKPKYLKYGNRQQYANNLKIGDIVDRHLRDGDVVLFNRQPSLHRMSVMAHFAKVKPWRTFRFNECCCTPYNADFDGDEMNLHLPQTEEARAEAMELMGIKYNLVTPRHGVPLIAATQDFITASYLLTLKDSFFNRAQFAQITSFMGDALMEVDIPPPAVQKPVRLWTGKQIFSILLRPNKKCPVRVNLETKNKSFTKPKGPAHMCPSDGFIIIQDSVLMCGVIDKSVIGDGSKDSIFYVVLREYGGREAAICMNRLAKVCARWLANRGFSIGIEDVQPGEELKLQKEDVVEKGYSDCDQLIAKSNAGELENQPGCNQEQTLEAKISGVLSKIRDDVGQCCFQELNRHNAPLIMSVCGSKGSKINVSQMVACVGQQIISGNRIPNGFGDRSLPHFPRKSKIPPAKGFVRNSFYSGLTPYEFFFHAVSGREGLVDTAVKTAETGYMQRRLMKALEDLVTHYDGSVRNSTGGIIQFKYGDDGLDPIHMEGGDHPVNFERSFITSKQLNPSSKKEKGLLPYEIQKILDDELSKKSVVELYSEKFSGLLREFIESKIKSLVQLRACLKMPTCETEDSMDESVDAATQNALDNCNKITKKQLKHFLSVCYNKYKKSIIEPGTAVGAIGGQSLGEPGTQMTLKTFHFAGVASMNITLGVPRIKEIINASKNISTPIISADLLNKTSDVKSARIVKGRIEKTIIEDVAEYIKVVIRSNECYVLIKIDLEAIEKLTLEVDIYSIAKSIVLAPKLKIPENYVRIHKPDKIAVNIPMKGDTNELFYALEALKRALPKVIIKGIPSINRAVINEEKDGLKLLVEGYGLREVMAIDGINGLESSTNHIIEMQHVLGIEAARNSIIKEIQYTMQSHGMQLDFRHCMLLSDLMTFKGEILGITRFGIAKMKDSVLMLASFEKTTDHLFDASFYGKKDSIDGVSECVIMGIPMHVGTGIFKLLQKTEKELPKPHTLLFDSKTHHLRL